MLETKGRVSVENVDLKFKGPVAWNQNTNGGPYSGFLLLFDLSSA